MVSQNELVELIGEVTGEQAIGMLTCLLAVVRAVANQPGIDSEKFFSDILKRIEPAANTSPAIETVLGAFRTSIQGLAGK